MRRIKHSTIRTNWSRAIVAIVLHLVLVRNTYVLRLYLLYRWLNILQKSARNQLVGVKRFSTMRTKRLAFSQPFSNATTTTQFITVRAHYWVVQFIKTNETCKYLIQYFDLLFLLHLNFKLPLLYKKLISGHIKWNKKFHFLRKSFPFTNKFTRKYTVNCFL